MYAANGTSKPEYIRFQANVPERISGMKYAAGRQVTGMSGEQMMYTATDGRRFYLDMDVAAKLERMGLSLGTPFWIVKRRSGKSKVTTWEIYLDDPQPGANESALERDLRLSASPGYVNAHKQYVERSLHGELMAPKQENGAFAAPPAPAPQSPQHTRTPSVESAPRTSLTDTVTLQDTPAAMPSRPRTQLEAALCTAVQACHAAQAYAREIGYGVTFTSEDLRAMAITLVIQARDRQRAA